MDKGKSDKLRHYLGLAVVAIIFGAVTWLLYKNLRTYDLQKVRAK